MQSEIVSNLDSEQQPQEEKAKRQTAIIGIGGGKGGIGKTLLTANLSVCFAKTGLKVVMVDADLGGSNLHTCFGIDQPEVSLGDFVKRKVENIEDTIIETGVDGLGLISGAQDYLAAANIKYTQKIRLLRKIGHIDTDLIILDLGAGSSFNVLDFFLSSDLGLVMMVPEPTSVENSYRFIRSAFFRMLRHREKSAPFRKVIEEAMGDENERGIRTPYDLIRVVSKMDPERGDIYRAWMLAFRPLLVINQARMKDDFELGAAVQTACRKYFGIDLDYLGCIAYDDSVWQSVRRRKALIHDAPDSNVASSIWNISREISQRLEEIEQLDDWKIE